MDYRVVPVTSGADAMAEINVVVRVGQQTHDADLLPQQLVPVGPLAIALHRPTAEPGLDGMQPTVPGRFAGVDHPSGDDEFDAPQELLDLHKKKDYGKYADEQGQLRTCFITTNDITGGNSGSPIINANGEWVGIAFDGNWEAMSGDLVYDEDYKRCINVDARYVLFVIDKFAGAGHLVNEMTLVNAPNPNGDQTAGAAQTVTSEKVEVKVKDDKVKIKSKRELRREKRKNKKKNKLKC
mgnify:CR=1 FL=1